MDLRRAGSRSSNNIELRSTPASPAHRNHLGGIGGGGYSSPAHRNQNAATKAAAQRLAKVMASQHKQYNDEYDDDDDDDDDDEFKFAPPSSGISNLPAVPFARRNRSQSPAINRYFNEHNTSSVRSSSTGRASMFGRPVAPNVSPIWRPPKVSLRPPLDPPFKDRDNRYYGDVPLVNSRDKGYQRKASALRDELDMLQEENETVLDKLHYAEEKRQAAEARARELEKQVLFSPTLLNPFFRNFGRKQFSTCSHLLIDNSH